MRAQNVASPAGISGLRQAAPRAQIRRRLALISAISTGAVMLAFCLPLAIYVRNVAYDRAVDGGELAARAMAAQLASVTNVTAIGQLVRRANSASANQVTIVLADGRQVGAALGRSAIVPLAVRAGHAVTTTAPGGGRLAWEPVHDGRVVAAVAAQVPPRLLSSGVARTWALLFGGGALLVLIAVGLADWLGRSIVRPLQRLVTVTRRLRDGELDRRAVPAGPSEVAEVGQAVNELAEQINRLLASARLAAADLGHRLRTPLTALRLDVERLDDSGAKAALQQDLDILEAAVNQLIRQNRDAARRIVARTDLAEAVRDRMAFWNVLARSQDRPVAVQVPAGQACIGIGRDELDAAIDAVLANIFAHNPDGTGFAVELRRSGPGQPAWSLLVENDGHPATVPPGDRGPSGRRPAAAAQETPGPTPRERSADSARAGPDALPGDRPGTGLGLDIVRRTAASIGGTVRAGATAAGGFAVEITFPDQPADLDTLPASGNGPAG